MNHKIYFIGVLALLVLFPLAAQAAESVGEFTHIEGRVDITSPGEAARPANLGDEINMGDIIRAKSKSKAEITFSDGNILRLAQNTRVEITEYVVGKEGTSGVLYLYRGKIQSIIKEVLGKIFGLNKKHRYEVHTPTAVVGVRGTDFFMYYQRGISGTIVKDGECCGYSKNRSADVMCAKELQAMVFVSADARPIVRPATEEEIQRYEEEMGTSEGEEEGEEKKEGKAEGIEEKSETAAMDEGPSEGAVTDEPDTGGVLLAGEEPLGYTPFDDEGELFPQLGVVEPTGGTQPPGAIDLTDPASYIVPEPPPTFRSEFEGGTFRLLPGIFYEGEYYDARVGEVDVGWNNPQRSAGPYHGSPYDGFWYEYDYVSTSGNGHGFKETYSINLDDEGSEYLPDGTYFGWEIDRIPRITERGTWDFDLSDLRVPPPVPARDYYPTSSRSWPSNSLEEVGWFDGIMEGVGNLWTATSDGPAALTLLGASNALDQPSLFGTEIHSYNPDNLTFATPDGGAYAGFMGGIFNDVEGRIYALYVDPDNKAGFLKGTFLGDTDPGSQEWNATGKIYHEYLRQVNPLNLHENLDRGIMTSQGFAGDFGVEGSYFDSLGGWGSTLSITGEDWGVFHLFLGYDNESDAPPSGEWAADVGGHAEFGSYEDGGGVRHDLGKWLAHAEGSASNGTISGNVSGKFLTMTKMGTLDGEMLGTYADAPNDWQAVSLGTWEKTQDLTFSNWFEGDIWRLEKRLRHLNIYGDSDADGDATVYMSIYTDTRQTGMTRYFDDSDDSTTWRVYHGNGRYDQWVYDSGGRLIDFSSDTYAFDDISEIADPASQGLAPGTPQGPFPANRLRNWWDFEGIMGSPDNLWASTQTNQARLTSLGHYDGDPDLGGPAIFLAEVDGYNPYDNTYTTRDGGAYLGYTGGIIYHDLQEDVDTIEGMIYAVYIDPQQNAGILKGAIDGEVYPDIEMWDAEGSVYPIQIASNVGVEPVELVEEDVIWRQSEWFIYTPPIHWAEFLDDAGSPVGDIMLDHWYRERIKIHQDERWGVTLFMRGGTYEDPSRDNWGKAFDGWEDGVLRHVGEFTGSKWSDSQIAGTGYQAWVHIDWADTGVAGAELKGTFDPNTHTWQSVEFWSYMDTNRFLDMAATSAGRNALTELNIPCIEVGKATLTQQADTTINNLQNVHMNDVTFFAYSTGADPRIWATNNVGGDYIGTPSLTGAAVPLSGNNLNVNFTVNRRWDSGKWGADVSGGGTYSGTGTMNGSTIDMKGGAAGTYTGGSFSGTGAGVAKPQ